MKRIYATSEEMKDKQEVFKELVEFAMKKRFEIELFEETSVRRRFYSNSHENELLHGIYLRLGLFTKRKNTTMTDVIWTNSRFTRMQNTDLCVFEIRNARGGAEIVISIPQEHFQMFGYLEINEEEGEIWKAR